MSSSPSRKKHNCVIGGFPWLATFRQFSNFDTVPGWLLETAKNKKVILVSLQAKISAIESVIPNELVSAIKEAPNDWLWLLRRHPSHMYVKKEVLSALKGVPDDRFIIDGVTDIALYSLLKMAVHHITSYSSVIYEAEAFGVSNSLFGDDALALYGDKIAAGRFHYFKTSEELLEQIFRSIRGGNVTWNGEKYIESGPNLAASALETLICSQKNAQSTNQETLQGLKII
jgi:hypothetical protein